MGIGCHKDMLVYDFSSTRVEGERANIICL